MTEAPDILKRYAPPFDLRSDLLFAMAACPSGPLRRTFPDVPFLSLAGRTPLIIWFGRITEVCYGDGHGNRHCEGGPGTVMYDELNVAALLLKRGVFVPGIYATSERSVQIAHRYGMPKRLIPMSFTLRGRQLGAEVVDGAVRSMVQARLLGSGQQIPRLLSLLWPLWSWPAEFPSGGRVAALIQATPRVYLARIEGGQLALDESWLPKPVRLLPIGLYSANLSMQLPSP